MSSVGDIVIVFVLVFVLVFVIVIVSVFVIVIVIVIVFVFVFRSLTVFHYKITNKCLKHNAHEVKYI